MSERPGVLVDMDGVLADFDSEVLRRMELHHPEVRRLPVRAHFYIADDYPEHKAAIRTLCNDEGFFASLGTVEGALEGWQRLLDLGYHPRVCSSPISANPHSEREKLAWLDKRFAPVFGRTVVDEAVITKDKHLVPGVVLIDDRPEIRDHHLAAWRHVVFDRPYNQHVTTPRLRSWVDPGLAGLLAG